MPYGSPSGLSAARNSRCSFSSLRTKRARVGGGEACSQDGKGRPVVVGRGKHLLGRGAEGSRRDIPDALAVCIVGALEEEEARRAAVVALGERAHLPCPHDADQPGLLEHLHVVADRSLRAGRASRRAPSSSRALAQQDDDLSREGRPRAPAAAPARARQARRPRRSPAAAAESARSRRGRPRRPAKHPPRAISPNERNGPLIRNVRLFPPVRKSPVLASHVRGQAPSRKRHDFVTKVVRGGRRRAERGESRASVNKSLQSRHTSVTGPGPGRGSAGHRLRGRGADRRRGAPERARRGAAPGSRGGRARAVPSSPRRATRGSRASCARRRSRSRRCRSLGRATTSTRATSRSRARPTARPTTRSPPSARCSRRRPRPRTTSSSACRRAAAREDLPQLLRQARRHARPLPRARLAVEGYRLPDHPVQQACRAAHAEAADVDAAELPTATDGCGVVTFALPLERMAYAFARFEQLPGRDPRRRRDARASGARRRPRRRRLRADARHARLVREGRRRGPALRRGRRRARHRAQERGRLEPSARPGARRLPRAARRRPARPRTVPVTSSRGELVGEVAVATS